MKYIILIYQNSALNVQNDIWKHVNSYIQKMIIYIKHL